MTDKERSNQSDAADQKISAPTLPGADDPKRLPAGPYQNAIASAAQRVADTKNSVGRGKNETNIVLYPFLNQRIWVRVIAIG